MVSSQSRPSGLLRDALIAVAQWPRRSTGSDHPTPVTRPSTPKSGSREQGEGVGVTSPPCAMSFLTDRQSLKPTLAVSRDEGSPEVSLPSVRIKRTMPSRRTENTSLFGHQEWRNRQLESNSGLDCPTRRYIQSVPSTSEQLVPLVRQPGSDRDDAEIRRLFYNPNISSNAVESRPIGQSIYRARNTTAGSGHRARATFVATI